MSSALALYTPQEQVALAADVWPLANRLSKTEFVPKPLRDKPEAVMACMLKGSELGIPLMQSLSQIHVIEGRPTMSAELMRAVVTSKGHEIWIEESTTTRCVIIGRRAGTDRDQKFTFTIDDARTAGLMGKQVWKSWPAQMLIARASGILCRTVFADCLAGISYTMEELEDGVAADGFDPAAEPAVAPAAKPKNTARARNVATRGAAATTPDAPIESPTQPPRGEMPLLPGEDDIVDADIVEDEDDATPAAGSPRPDADAVPVDDFPPYVDPDPAYEPANDDTGSRMSGPSRIAMLMNQHGVTLRADKQRAVAQLIGHTIESTKELTPDETGLIIQFLNNLADGEAFPFDDVGEGVPVPANSPDAKAAAPPDAAPPSPQPSAPGSAAESWSDREWREHLKSRGIKVTTFIPEVKRMAEAAGAKVVTLDEIAGVGIADDLLGWCEENKATS